MKKNEIIYITKARFKRLTSDKPNRMLMRENKGFFAFAFDFGSCELLRLNLGLGNSSTAMESV